MIAPDSIDEFLPDGRCRECLHCCVSPEFAKAIRAGTSFHTHGRLCDRGIAIVTCECQESPAERWSGHLGPRASIGTTFPQDGCQFFEVRP